MGPVSRNLLYRLSPSLFISLFRFYLTLDTESTEAAGKLLERTEGSDPLSEGKPRVGHETKGFFSWLLPQTILRPGGDEGVHLPPLPLAVLLFHLTAKIKAYNKRIWIGPDEPFYFLSFSLSLYLASSLAHTVPVSQESGLPRMSSPADS